MEELRPIERLLFLILLFLDGLIVYIIYNASFTIYELSQIVIVIILILFLSEILLEYSICPRYFTDFSHTNPSELSKDIDKMSSHDLTLIAATITALAFLLNLLNNGKDLTGPVIIVVFGFSFILVSYWLSSLSNYKELIYSAQKTLQQYGIISIVIGIVMAFGILIPEFAHFLILIPISGVIIHIVAESIFFDIISQNNGRKGSIN